MRILLTIMANIMVAVVSIMTVHEYHALKRYASFTMPFTDKMISLGVIDASRRDSLLKEEKIGHYIGIILSVIVWLMLARFMAGVSAIAVFVIAVAAQIIFLKPELTETESTRNQYFSAHKKDMNELKYHDYLKSINR